MGHKVNFKLLKNQFEVEYPTKYMYTQTSCAAYYCMICTNVQIEARYIQVAGRLNRMVYSMLFDTKMDL